MFIAYSKNCFKLSGSWIYILLRIWHRLFFARVCSLLVTASITYMMTCRCKSFSNLISTFFHCIPKQVERGPTVYLSGLREKHFGKLFLNAFNISGSSSATQTSSSQSASSELDLSEEGLKHIARYIEYFESRYNDIWLVFHHEGVSLSKLMYTVEEAENTSAGEKASHGQILRPSKWWTWLKTTESGKEEMRRIIWQLVRCICDNVLILFLCLIDA